MFKRAKELKFLPNNRFLRSMNFRFMVFLFLIGTVPLFVFSGAVLSAYKSQAVTRLGNDVSNQCQILATQIGSTGYLDRVGNETLAGELMQMATLNDGRIIIIDQDLQIVEDTYELEKGRTMVAEEVIRCFQGESTGRNISGRFIEMTVPIVAGGEENKTIIGVILASASTDSITARLEELWRATETWLVAIAICVFALSILLSNWLVRPLRHMNQSIGGLVEGSLDGDLDIHDCTETEVISNT